MLRLDKSLWARQTDNAHGLLSAPLMNGYTRHVPDAGRHDALERRLPQAGVGCEIYYPVPVHQLECFAHLPRPALPVAERAAGEQIAVVDAIFACKSSAALAHA